MNLEKHLPLTETTYYILLSLLEPGHGYAVMQKAEELSGGRVRIAAGTMYGALENLLKQKLIASVPSSDPRRKMYKTTEEGARVLKLEVQRLKHMVDIYNRIQGDE
ncbi:PadR family transcriptional regulator [Acetivibrio thermocellus AD2]|uniref:PadR family transcriptional regulator n=1 Tax=Acetivibrio thermocellus AD2 TaxID=1138384 RepID=A0AB36TI69_ACETH|nr:helix-turn-helix transcriptional regulator [Acetivibrio thermocellus]CDG36156.1 transcriptional regulator, PadR-like family [Acetivibrio thermocellus BC1]ADU75285.1 transcriptional regulator PadR family protein [Acetivibrio thermocellus DSM 1313]ALX09274.1 transcriptional regulator, PadR-like family [Acetivibrio thermocellus AD2]ANV77026.1 transcriptional regulator, PadR-like family [Acetivibrio thermocellus DSM 2360]EIC04742.1 transcriptional regulator PadR family protein [Acetivibrio ther